jgi:hypothetical protein
MQESDKRHHVVDKPRRQVAFFLVRLVPGPVVLDWYQLR